MDLRRIAYRLKEVRNSVGLNQTDFAQSLGLKQGSYSDIERGKANISSHVLMSLIRIYRVNPIWLYDGKLPRQIDEIFLNQAANAPAQQTAKSYFSTQDGQELLEFIDAQLNLEGSTKNRLKQGFLRMLQEISRLQQQLINHYEVKEANNQSQGI